ncbi:hypothetical protein DFH06DRAFT_1387651 [Mycena polygramma]|nr:hypothetical protein DFH06DRAFT_1387651 [Mycena polygramma]
MPFPANTTPRRQSSRRLSVELVLESLPAALLPKRLRSASLPLPSPHNPLAVPRKSALKRPRSLFDLPCPSNTYHIQLPSAKPDKEILSEEVKLALSLEAEVAHPSSMPILEEICARVQDALPVALTRRRRRVYSMSREEYRASALRRHANLPPPADWDEIPCKVHFNMPAPPAPAPEQDYEEPACDSIHISLHDSDFDYMPEFLFAIVPDCRHACTIPYHSIQIPDFVSFPLRSNSRAPYHRFIDVVAPNGTYKDFPSLRTEGGTLGPASAGIVAFLRERPVDLEEEEELAPETYLVAQHNLKPRSVHDGI